MMTSILFGNGDWSGLHKAVKRPHCGQNTDPETELEMLWKYYFIHLFGTDLWQ